MQARPAPRHHTHLSGDRSSQRWRIMYIYDVCGQCILQGLSSTECARRSCPGAKWYPHSQYLRLRPPPRTTGARAHAGDEGPGGESGVALRRGAGLSAAACGDRGHRCRRQRGERLEQTSPLLFRQVFRVLQPRDDKWAHDLVGCMNVQTFKKSPRAPARTEELLGGGRRPQASEVRFGQGCSSCDPRVELLAVRWSATSLIVGCHRRRA